MKGRKPYKTTCLVCGKDFYPFWASLSKYCSKRCEGVGKKGKSQGKKGMHISPNTEFKKGQMSGKNNPSWKDPIQLACVNCKKIFYKKPWQLRKKGKGKFVIGYFCSPQCRMNWYHKNLKGKNNPQYVGGKISYYGDRWQEVKEKARELDKNRCQVCGKKRKNIHVHHIRSYKLFDKCEEANELSNLICVCNKCHPKLTYKKLTTINLFVHIDTNQ